MRNMRPVMMFLTALTVVSVCVGLSACRKIDIRTAGIQVPGMKSEACAQLVVTALAREQGVKVADVRVDLQKRLLEVDYDSLKHSLKNLEYTIARAGFAANEIPADEKARAALPEGCR